jgi:methionyl-tRNA formyltransferase
VKLGPVLPLGEPYGLAAGELRADKRRVVVGTGSGPVQLGDVLPQGKRVMPASDWARGVRPVPGERFG